MSRGFTLVEVIASLAILGVAMAVVGLSTRATPATAADRIVVELRAAHAKAVREGRAVDWKQGSTSIRFRPDGSANAVAIAQDSGVVVVDPLTGDARAQRR